MKDNQLNPNINEANYIKEVQNRLNLTGLGHMNEDTIKTFYQSGVSVVGVLNARIKVFHIRESAQRKRS